MSLPSLAALLAGALEGGTDHATGEGREAGALVPGDDLLSLAAKLDASARPVNAVEACRFLALALPTVADEDAQKLLDAVLALMPWWSLGEVLSLVRNHSLPPKALPSIYRFASRLVRDPSAGTESFRTGAFREHPGSWFEIGEEGGLRLGGRSRGWGQLRGYSFACWVNLRKATKPGERRQIFRCGNSPQGVRLETYLWESQPGEVWFMIRSRTQTGGSWTSLQGAVSVAIGRWHFLVVSHVRPYLLGRAKVQVFLDGVLQPSIQGSVPFPASNEMDDCVLGMGLQGCMGGPALFEGGEIGVEEANALCSRARIAVEPPHVVGSGHDEEVDDEDDQGTGGLGYGRDDAADHQIEAGHVVVELAARAGVLPADENRKIKRMVFVLDPRAFNADYGTCPELVIRGVRRGQRDALELVPDADETGGLGLVDDEGVDDARLEGDCTVRLESASKKDAVELAGGSRSLLLAVRDAPAGLISEALMLLGDALHADSHLRTTFLGIEGFGLVGRELRRRPMDQDQADIVVQVILHMMRSAPVNSLLEKEFACAGLREVLLDSRASPDRLASALRLVSGLAAEHPRWVRSTVGVEGILRVMLRLADAEKQAELVTEVLRHFWTMEPSEDKDDDDNDDAPLGPTPHEAQAVLSFIVEHPDLPGACHLVRELRELVETGPGLASMQALGGVPILIRLGSFAERNIKNPATGVILRDPDPLPALLSPISPAPVDTREELLRLVGSLMKRNIGLRDVETDPELLFGALLATLNPLGGPTETNESLVKAVLDTVPWPGALAVWSPLAQEAGDAKGMARVADALRRDVAMCRAVAQIRGWQAMFAQLALAPGPLGVAARSALTATITHAEDVRSLEELVRGTPALVWSDVCRSIVTFPQGVPPTVLSRALSLARRSDFFVADERDWETLAFSCLAAAESLREKTIAPWLAWAIRVLVRAKSNELVANAVKACLSILSKEMAKPTPENRKRALGVLAAAGAESFESSTGQLRAELCLGVMQMYPLDDDGQVEKKMSMALEQASTIQGAVRRVLEMLVLTSTEEEEPPVFAPLDELQIWVVARSMHGTMPARVSKILKTRAAVDVRDRLAHRVTDRVRDLRFDARWESMIEEDAAEHVALRGDRLAWTLDENFCERGSRMRRRMLPVGPSLASAPTPTTPQPRSSPRALTVAPAPRPSPLSEDNDWVKIGEELSRRVTVMDPTSQAAQPQPSGPEDESADAPGDILAAGGSELGQPLQAGGTSTSSSATGASASGDVARKTSEVSATATAPPQEEVEAKVKKMTMEEWVNRPPLSIRGELEGRWIDPKSGERIIMAARAFLVRAQGECAGRLVVTTVALYFDPDPPGAAGHYFKSNEEEDEGRDVHKLNEPRQRWPVRAVQRILLRRFRMLESACEIFMRGDSCSSVFLRFDDVSPAQKRRMRQIRDQVVRAVLMVLPRAARERSQRPKTNLRDLVAPATQAWRCGALSNYDYLAELNALAGRSVHDLCQYPVFPWILSDYASEELNDLEDPAIYRDLSKPMGALSGHRLEQYIERYESFDDPSIPKFMYGSHYSTAAGVVLHFLVRVEPFRTMHLDIHDKHYDKPDRMFTSVPLAWEASSTSADLGEVKELTPEFYSLPAVFENRGHFDFGVSQSGVKVDNVALPPWAKGSADTFVRTMRAALESNHVSAHLHLWINLVFGFQQRGPESVKANNVFYYLTYPGAVDLEAIEDANIRRAAELQIAHFGQCPEQLEPAEPWPVREWSVSKHGQFTLRPRSGVEQGFSVDSQLVTVLARHVKRTSLERPVVDGLTSDDGGGGGLLALRDDGSIHVLVRAPGLEAESKGDRRAKSQPLQGVFQPRLAIWTPDSSLLLSVGRAAVGTVDLTMLDGHRGDGSPVARGTLFAHEEKITAMAYHDGLLVTGAADGSMRLWRLGRVGALRRPTVWTSPRRFLRGHSDGSPILCAAVCRSMGVVASCSRQTLIVHDTKTGRVLWSVPSMGGSRTLEWDRRSGSLLVLLSNGRDLATVGIDGAVLSSFEHEDNVVTSCVIAPATALVARPTSIEVVELPMLRVLQTWPLLDVVAVAPMSLEPKLDVDEDVVVSLVTSSRTVFVLRRMLNAAAGNLEERRRLSAPSVVGAVSSAMSGAARGQSLIGTLDKVAKGVEVGRGVAGEAWELFSSVSKPRSTDVGKR